MGRESGEASVARNERGGRDLFRGRAETLLAEARAINATSDGETHENERVVFALRTCGCGCGGSINSWPEVRERRKRGRERGAVLAILEPHLRRREDRTVVLGALASLSKKAKRTNDVGGLAVD